MTRTNPPLQVVGFVGTKRGDADRGPAVRLRAEEAAKRQIEDGELVWVYGPRRHDLAQAIYDDSIPKGGVVARDIAGIAVTEIIRLVKVDSDRPVLQSGKHFA
ncbi:MAG TPA: molybdopterin dinucleotide binding domain-containing protein [Gemmatimonadaceae bacterium]|nr:molybdopterin dinucleotide binding domain-containing protein [Gemmatimonadaceae bacterium]